MKTLHLITIVFLCVVIFTGCTNQSGFFQRTAEPSQTPTIIPTPTSTPVADFPASGIAEFHILHWNDFHDEIIERWDGDRWIPGAARLSAFVKTEREEYGRDSVLTLDAGDWLQGDQVPDDSRGQNVLNFYKQLGVDAVTLGNHELNFGQTRFLDLMQEAAPVNILNVNFQKTNDEGQCTKTHLTDAYKIFVMGDPGGAQVRVAVIGETAAYEEYDVKSPPHKFKVCFSEPLQKIIDLYDRLKNVEKADVIVLLTHQGFYVDQEMAQQLIDAGTPMDFIIGGHQDYGYDEPIMVGNTYVLSVEDHGTEVGVIDIAYDRGTKSMDVKWRQEAFTPQSPQDPEVLAMFSDLIPTPTAVIPGDYLANLQPSSVSVGYWTLGVGVYPPNSDFQGETVITAHDKIYSLGLFAHASSELVYDLNGMYSTLISDVLIKESSECSDGASFAVVLDGKEIYNSGLVLPLEEPKQISLDVSGGKVLKLITREEGVNINCDWTIWGDPFLKK